MITTQNHNVVCSHLDISFSLRKEERNVRISIAQVLINTSKVEENLPLNSYGTPRSEIGATLGLQLSLGQFDPTRSSLGI